MSRKVHECQCLHCQQEADHPDKEPHRQINLLMSRLDEQQRRWYTAIESNRIGHGGVRLMSQITGISPTTISRGRTELATALVERPSDRVRKSGGGQQLTENKYPTIEATLEQMLADEVAGDPMRERKWVRSSMAQLSQRLKGQNLSASPTTVSRLLKKMGYSMKINLKKRRALGSHPDRDKQFQYIASQREEFGAVGLPIISVDTKKKEMIGNFKSKGKVWCKDAEEVNVYDFSSLATCIAVPYGIYDVMKNRGYIYVGTSANTPQFAVDAIARWWKYDGCVEYTGADKLLILADGAGGNGWRSRAWKFQIQKELCDEFGLTVTVCHYPPRCSKWNPIEHRLFSHISMNWAGKPLRTLEVMLGYIRGTTTKTGLTVKAFLQEGVYLRGQKVSKKDFEQLALRPHAVCPNWNYTISPRSCINADSIATELHSVADGERS